MKRFQNDRGAEREGERATTGRNRSNAVDKRVGDLFQNITNVLLVIHILDLQQMFSKKNQGQYHTLETTARYN